jgi:hypothetical protein
MLVDKLDLSRVGNLNGTTLRREVRLVVERLVDTENPLLNRMERERLIEEVLDETFGFGPLESLLRDRTIRTLAIFGPRDVRLERQGLWHAPDVRFRDDEHLDCVLDRVKSFGRSSGSLLVFPDGRWTAEIASRPRNPGVPIALFRQEIASAEPRCAIPGGPPSSGPDSATADLSRPEQERLAHFYFHLFHALECDWDRLATAPPERHLAAVGAKIQWGPLDTRGQQRVTVAALTELNDYVRRWTWLGETEAGNLFLLLQAFVPQEVHAKCLVDVHADLVVLARRLCRFIKVLDWVGLEPNVFLEKVRELAETFCRLLDPLPGPSVCKLLRDAVLTGAQEVLLKQGGRASARFSRIEDLKRALREKVVQTSDWSRLSGQGLAADPRAHRLVGRLCDAERFPLNASERASVVEEVVDEVFGFGPLEKLFSDPTIRSIAILASGLIKVQRTAPWLDDGIQFRDKEITRAIIDQLKDMAHSILKSRGFQITTDPPSPGEFSCPPAIRLSRMGARAADTALPRSGARAAVGGGW